VDPAGSATVSASPWGRSSTTGATGSRTDGAALGSVRRGVTLYSSLMSAFSVSPRLRRAIADRDDAGLSLSASAAVPRQSPTDYSDSGDPRSRHEPRTTSMPADYKSDDNHDDGRTPNNAHNCRVGESRSA